MKKKTKKPIRKNKSKPKINWKKKHQLALIGGVRILAVVFFVALVIARESFDSWFSIIFFPLTITFGATMMLYGTVKKKTLLVIGFYVVTLIWLSLGVAILPQGGDSNTVDVSWTITFDEWEDNVVEGNGTEWLTSEAKGFNLYADTQDRLEKLKLAVEDMQINQSNYPAVDRFGYFEHDNPAEICNGAFNYDGSAEVYYCDDFPHQVRNHVSNNEEEWIRFVLGHELAHSMVSQFDEEEWADQYSFELSGAGTQAETIYWEESFAFWNVTLEEEA